MTESESSRTTGFVVGIGPLAAVSLVVGTMIGSGIFIVSADIARQVGDWGPGALLVVWAVTGLMTVVGALAYAELAAMMPEAGGQYLFLREGLSPLVGFLFGWTLFAVIQTGTIAAVAVAFGKFLGVLVPALTPDVFLSLGHLPMPGGPIEVGVSWQRLMAVAVVALLTAVNIRGVRLGARIQTLFAIAKVGALGALVLFGLALPRPAATVAAATPFWGTGAWNLAVLPVLGAAMVGSLFAADAWNNVTFAAAEVRNPRRNLPLALGLGTTIVTVLYLLTNLAYLRVLPFHGDPAGLDVFQRGIAGATQDRVGVAATEALFGAPGGVLMAVAIMLSTFGCANGLILAGPRVYYAMARDRLFFARAAQLHPKFQTPAFALVAQALVAMLLCLSGSYGNLLTYVIFASLLFYLFTVLALFRLRATRPELPRPVRAFGYPGLPLGYLAAVLFLLLVLLIDPVQRQYSAFGLLIVALGVPVYFAWRRAAA
jgi:APA family basic amino acid/polyamine antiporter